MLPQGNLSPGVRATLQRWLWTGRPEDSGIRPWTYGAVTEERGHATPAGIQWNPPIEELVDGDHTGVSVVAGVRPRMSGPPDVHVVGPGHATVLLCLDVSVAAGGESIHMHTLCPAEAGDGTAIERPATRRETTLSSDSVEGYTVGAGGRTPPSALRPCRGRRPGPPVRRHPAPSCAACCRLYGTARRQACRLRQWAAAARWDAAMAASKA